MQLIGIYLHDADIRVRKNLKESQWYPFGNFTDCHYIFNETESSFYDSMKAEIKDNQSFINKLYNIKESKNTPSININCIVGKNGAGKSSLLALLYRIINNFSCKINYCLQNYNKDYSPNWAYGFNAELYYELNGEIFCIKVKDNLSIEENLFNVKDYETGRVDFIFKGNEKLDKLFAYLESDENRIDNHLFNKENLGKIKKEEKRLLKLLSDTIFYSIATNYSIYSNTVVIDKWSDDEELWMTDLYHKNDGYITPIVLVPYKEDGKLLDSKKELSLAEERIGTLSILSLAEKGANDFIENFIPSKIEYKLISKEDYQEIMQNKTLSFFESYLKYKIKRMGEQESQSEEDLINLRLFLRSIESPDSYKTNPYKLFTLLRNKWNEFLFSAVKEAEYITSWKKKDKKTFEQTFETIKSNTLDYLSYKVLKICLYYDSYDKMFDNGIILDFINDEKAVFETKIEKLIKFLIEINNDDEKVNFINLKIEQCISFLSNLDFYIKDIKFDDILMHDENIQNSIIIKDFTDKFFNKEKVINYDYIFKNLLPHFIIKEFYYSKKNITSPDDKDIPLSALSSGESQLLNSLSYAIYHAKNASCHNKNDDRINYHNINLILDEAELYYHPEYQRTFISDLLGIIQRSNLKETVNSINITIVTHSPFLLSDIPESNILYLKDGDIYQNKDKYTLGANIYDLLKNQFFMNHTIGANSNNVVQNFLKKVQKQRISGKELDFYEKFINNIGEEYLNTVLKNMLDKFKAESSFKERKRKDLERRLNRLKQKEKEYENELKSLEIKND